MIRRAPASDSTSFVPSSISAARASRKSFSITIPLARPYPPCSCSASLATWKEAWVQKTFEAIEYSGTGGMVVAL